MLHITNKRHCNNTVYGSLKFCGDDNLRAIQPSNLRDTLGVVQPPPIFWWTHPHALAVGFGFFVNSGFSSSLMEGMKPPLFRQWWSLFLWVGVFCIKGEDASSSLSPMWKGTYPFHSPHLVWPCQPWPSLVSGHIYLGIHYLPASMGIDVTPSMACTCSFQCPWPHHVT